MAIGAGNGWFNGLDDKKKDEMFCNVHNFSSFFKAFLVVRTVFKICVVIKRQIQYMLHHTEHVYSDENFRCMCAAWHNIAMKCYIHTISPHYKHKHLALLIFFTLSQLEICLVNYIVAESKVKSLMDKKVCHYIYIFIN